MPTIIPTISTLAAETQPNTAAYKDYRWDSPDASVRTNFVSGSKSDISKNIRASNISFADARELLPNGGKGFETTQLIYWSVDWWGTGGHKSNGTISNTQAQMDARV